MPRLSAATSILSTALLQKIRAHLKRGGVIAYPTESCYGLGCDPRNRRAVIKLLRLKERPQRKGLILIGSDYGQLGSFAAPLTRAQTAKITPTWPGPVTWLLPVARNTPPWLRGRHKSIAVRVTGHSLASRLCKLLGMALVSTSANRSGLNPARTYAACVRAFGREALVVPGLIGKRKRPSAIMDLVTDAVIR